MFETMSSFLWAFFGSFGLIILGILFEEKLIAFERRVFYAVLRAIKKKFSRR